MTQFEIECIESRIDGPRDHYDKFLLEPLEQGQGITIGNALRRVLLSDLEGTSIVSVRIAGVNHEFSTISENSGRCIRNFIKLKGDYLSKAKVKIL